MECDAGSHELRVNSTPTKEMMPPLSDTRLITWPRVAWAISLILLFASAETSPAQIPTILRTSDAVKSGKSFTIDGDSITTSATAAIALASGTSPATPPAGATTLNIVQRDLTGKNHYMVATMPAVSAGVYNVWANNGSGWSPIPYKLNGARPLFMSEYQAYAGLLIEVAGRNFDRSEFGGTTATQVRLRHSTNGTTVAATIVAGSLNPYHVTFTVPTAAVVGAQYYVEVSNNNGVDWGTLDNGQLLEIVAGPPTGSDPLGMGVVWAKDFKWSTVKNVTQAPYNINPSDTTGSGDNAAVQQAVNDAHDAGGGIVYLPAGTYYLNFITLGAGVVLKGDGPSTRIIYSGGGGSSFIRSKRTSEVPAGEKPELQGIANLSLELSDQTIRPDQFISLGDFSVANDQRAGTRLFAVNVGLNYSYTTDGSASNQRGIGFSAAGKERLLVQNCNFIGWRGTIPSSGVAKYFTLRNNSFEYSTGYVAGSSTYSFWENNNVIVHSEFNQESHGLDARSDAYVANNFVQGTGGPVKTFNDGEAIMFETPGGNFNYGAVASATTTSLTVTAPAVALTAPTNLPYSDLSVLITEGRGIGQLRKVSVNPSTSTFTVAGDKPFSIVPNTTSRWTLYAPLRNATVYRNTIRNCAKGIWLYGNAYDDLAAENNSLDSAGIYLHSVSGGISSGVGIDCSGYFTRMTRNTVQGLSRWGNYAGIGLNTGRWNTGGAYLNTQTFGTEITGNTIFGNKDAVVASSPYPGEMGPYSGIYVISYGFSTQSNGVGTGDATNTIIEGNHLSNLKYGINLSREDSGNLLSANSYDSLVPTFVNEAAPASDNTIQLNNHQATVPGFRSEAESLTVAAQTAGITYRVSNQNQFSAGKAAYFDATAVNQSLTYAMPNIAAGTYDIRVGLKAWNNKGIWQLAISRLDGQGALTNVGPPIDEYTANETFTEVDLGNWTPGTTSDKAFTFTVTGKNASSSSYGLDFDYILLIPQ